MEIDKELYNLVYWASEIVNDYDNYGEVLQQGLGNEYENSPIENLRSAVNTVKERYYK